MSSSGGGGRKKRKRESTVFFLFMRESLRDSEREEVEKETHSLSLLDRRRRRRKGNRFFSFFPSFSPEFSQSFFFLPRACLRSAASQKAEAKQQKEKAPLFFVEQSEMASSLSAADNAASVPVPDIIKQFVVYLYRHIRCV